MCNRWLVCALAALALLPARAPSQSTASLERAVDSLAADWRAAERRLEQYDDSVRSLRLTYDTVLVPPLRILAQAPWRDLAARAASLANDSISRAAGVAAGRLQDMFLLLREPAANEARSGNLVVQVLTGGSPGWNTAQTPAEAKAVAGALGDVAIRALGRTLSPELRSWLGGPVRWDSLPADAWSHLRLSLVSLNTDTSRACFYGSLASCRSVLGLGSGPGVTQPSVAIPLRAAVARVAVQAGGRGAYERLLTASGAPARQLEAAAGMPLDSVVARWQARLRNSRGPSDDMSPGIAAMSAFWILVCGALAVRSSRWR